MTNISIGPHERFAHLDVRKPLQNRRNGPKVMHRNVLGLQPHGGGHYSPIHPTCLTKVDANVTKI